MLIGLLLSFASLCFAVDSQFFVGSVVIFKDGQYQLELPLLLNRSYTTDGPTINGFLTTTSVYSGTATTSVATAVIKESDDGSFAIALTGGNATIKGQGTGLTPQAIQGFVASGSFSMSVNGTEIAGTATLIAGDEVGPRGTEANMIEVVSLAQPESSTVTEIIKLGQVSGAVYSGLMGGLAGSSDAAGRFADGSAKLSPAELHHAVHAPKLATIAGMVAV
uniref:Dirigent protein n=1 Tax=Sexangularia sp. CB-2014 TaxID=1486929 RepID=A0A7S1YDY2_9EUKA|mmetsp:Transcript_15297/g.47765  ORF Transcript_15297/g.47765 Transcript_15297/m.47765 type:complete len:221 (+) Transcript_15297:49-711(+)